MFMSHGNKYIIYYQSLTNIAYAATWVVLDAPERRRPQQVDNLAV